MLQPEPSFAKRILPLFFVFVIVNSLILWFQPQLDHKKIDALVVFTANCLLFTLGILSLAMHLRALNKTNPNVFLRSVMGATMLKLLVLGGAALVYLFIAGKERSVYAVLAGMVLYVVYTVLEIRITLKMNQKK